MDENFFKSKFDWRAYVGNYGDLQKANIDTEEKAWNHAKRHGRKKKENRDVFNGNRELLRLFRNFCISGSVKSIPDKYKNKFVFIITSYNNEQWYKKNLDSIKNQTYKNWRAIYVDDASTDNTYKLVIEYVNNHKLNNKIKIIKNEKNFKQGYARYIAFKECNNDEICCLLDGDDWLFDNNVLNNLNKLYNENDISISYGKYMIYENGKNTNVTGNKNFPEDVINNNSYQTHPLWIPVHLRTGYAKLFKSYPYEYLLDFNNELISASTDQNEMFWILNKSKGKHKNAGFTTMVYNKDASLQNSNSYYHMKTNKTTELYRKEIQYYLKLNKLNRYEKKETILIFTDLDVHNEKLQNFCDLINFKYKLIFKNELLDEINNIKINVDHILFYDYKNITKELINKIKKFCNNILTNNSFENIDIYKENDIFLKLKKYNYNIVKKDFGEYNDLYNYSILIEHKNNLSTINQSVDKVYCINLLKDNNKLEKFINMLNKYNINCEILRMNKLIDSKIFMNIYKKLKYNHPGELGCLLSHLMCCLDAKKNNYKNIMILEDDAIPIKDLNNNFNTYKNSILNKPYVFLGASQWSWPNHIQFYENYYNAWRTCGSFALYLDKCVFDLLISEYKKMDTCIDGVMFNYYNTPPDNWDKSQQFYGINKKSPYYGKCIVLYPNLFIADVSESNIRKPQDNIIRSKSMKWNLDLYDFYY